MSTAPELGSAALGSLYELARDLLRLEDYDAMLDAVVRHALAILDAERGFLVVERRSGLDFKVVRNWRREELEAGEGEPLSRSIVREVLAAGVPLLVGDALSDRRFAEQESVLQQGVRSVLAAPIAVEGRHAGVLYLESRSLARLFDRPELELFERILELAQRALEQCLRRILLEQRASLHQPDFLARHDFQGIVTCDPRFLAVLETVAQIAPSDLPVLVQGPSGTGKELVVRALHANSRRSQGPFVTVNCGAISPALLESELFGHVRGAFTGAARDKTGLVATADGGTVFLDEVGELPQELQVKLLRTLQFGEVQPVGALRPRHVDVRFFAATNRDLEAEVREGRFREDLLYRLNVETLTIPPLGERPDDVLPLFYHFLRREAERTGRPVPQVSPLVERALEKHDWPGNVRELENETRRLLAITPEGEPVTVDRLSARLTRPAAPGRAAAVSLAEHERELIDLHLRRAGGNRTQAARNLGISREGLRKKMKRLGLD